MERVKSLKKIEDKRFQFYCLVEDEIANYGYSASYDNVSIRLFEAKLNNLRVKADLDRLVTKKIKLQYFIEKYGCYDVVERNGLAEIKENFF